MPTTDRFPFHLNGRSFSRSELEHWAAEIAANLKSEEWEKNLALFLLEWLSPTDFVLVKTSGSTGSPKTIELPKAVMRASAVMTAQRFELGEGQKALLCLSAGYVAGKMMLVRALSLGLHLTAIQPTSRPFESLSESFDLAACIPLQVQQSLAEDVERERIGNVRVVLVGGGPVSRELAEELRQMPTGFYATYGMTETASHVATRALSGPATSNWFEAMPEVVLSMHTNGCLTISAPHLNVSNILTTDLIEHDGHKRFRWLGRNNNIINSAGVKVIPEQIEEQLSKLTPKRTLVFGVNDELLGERVVLLIEDTPWPEAEVHVLLDQLAAAMPAYHIPKDIHFTTAFAETETGKIQRKKTIERLFHP